MVLASATQKADLHPLRRKVGPGPLQVAVKRQRAALEAWPGQAELLAVADTVRGSSAVEFGLQAWRDAVSDRISAAERLGWRAACGKRDLLQRRAEAVSRDGACLTLCKASIDAAAALVAGEVARAQACVAFVRCIDEAAARACGGSPVDASSKDTDNSL